MARPQVGSSERESYSEGIDIMLIVDVSSSMLAEDFQPNNRLRVAKEVVGEFISKRERDRVGMVVFARHAITKTPLTLDHDILLTHLEDIQVGSIPDGTSIGNAVASTVNRLKDSEVRSRIAILLTDGEKTAGEVDPITAAQLAKTFDKIKETRKFKISESGSEIDIEALLQAKTKGYGEFMVDEIRSKGLTILVTIDGSGSMLSLIHI